MNASEIRKASNDTLILYLAKAYCKETKTAMKTAEKVIKELNLRGVISNAETFLASYSI